MELFLNQKFWSISHTHTIEEWHQKLSTKNIPNVRKDFQPKEAELKKTESKELKNLFISFHSYPFTILDQNCKLKGEKRKQKINLTDSRKKQKKTDRNRIQKLEMCVYLCVCVFAFHYFIINIMTC